MGTCWTGDRFSTERVWQGQHLVQRRDTSALCRSPKEVRTGRREGGTGSRFSTERVWQVQHLVRSPVLLLRFVALLSKSGQADGRVVQGTGLAQSVLGSCHTGKAPCRYCRDSTRCLLTSCPPPSPQTRLPSHVLCYQPRSHLLQALVLLPAENSSTRRAAGEGHQREIVQGQVGHHQGSAAGVQGLTG